jgi:hypothetical protein
MLNKRLAAVAAMSTAQLTGATFRPARDPETDRWYRSLDKSRLTPPGGLRHRRDCNRQPAGFLRLSPVTAPPSASRSAALGCLAVSVLGVAAPPWTMFGRRRQDEATAATAGMVACSVGLVATAADVDRRAIVGSSAARRVGGVRDVSAGGDLAEEPWR